MEREKGPIEILCKEIGFRFEKRLEDADLLVSFVSVLVSQVAQMRGMQSQISDMTRKPPSDDSAEVLRLVTEMLASNDPDTLIDKAAAVHHFIHGIAPDEAYPCDHLIDMLSSCVSAIRFGLEVPCRSRHAGAAAQHIWKHLYGVHLFDSHTPNWENDWARIQLQEAIIQWSVHLEREACAQIAEAQAKVFASNEYATNQPLSSHGERFACGRIAELIRER